MKAFNMTEHRSRFQGEAKRTFVAHACWSIIRNHILAVSPLAITGCLLIVFHSESLAQSLWQQRNEDFAHFFVDTRAHNVGDLLTIVIDESTDVLKQDQRELGKTSDGRFRFDFTSAASGAPAANLNLGADSERRFDGNSQYRVAQVFSDQIAACVTKVLPNGYLQVRGTRTRIVSNEKRTLVVTGIVRPVDIMPNNTVRSQYVGKLDIRYVGFGVETHFSNQGWAAKALNRVWPF